MAQGRKTSTGIFESGIDPGLGCTAAVLMQDHKVLAVRTYSNSNSKQPIMHRMRAMKMGLYNGYVEWIHAFNIEKLHVVIETPVLNQMGRERCPTCGAVKGRFAVQGIIKQAWMFGAYQDALFDVAETTGCVIQVGEVSNTVAKKVFSGYGRAHKDQMINKSAWAKRPDISQRNHMADAQALGSCSPTLFDVSAGVVDPMNPSHIDDKVGKGPAWKGKC